MGNIFKLQKDKEYTKDKAKEIKAYHYGMGEKLPSKRLTYKIYNELIQFNGQQVHEKLFNITNHQESALKLQ